MKKSNNELPPMNPDPFEHQLQRQPLRPLPPSWRSEILAAAREAGNESSTSSQPSFAAMISQRLRPLLWPCPQAWAGLAAVWLIVLAIQFSLRPSEPFAAAKTPPPSPEMMAMIREQRQLLTQLIAPDNQSAAEPPKTFRSGPRSDYQSGVTLV